jgi:hypothetical protein
MVSGMALSAIDTRSNSKNTSSPTYSGISFKDGKWNGIVGH